MDLRIIYQRYSPDIREICITAVFFYRRGYHVDIMEEGDDKKGTK